MVLTAIPVGFVAGLFGIGGGLITVPFLYFIFESLEVNPDYIMHLAVGTSFAIIIPTSTVSVLTHHKFKAVDFEIVKGYGFFVAIGVILGTILAASLKTKPLILFFTVVVYILAFYLLFLMLLVIKIEPASVHRNFTERPPVQDYLIIILLKGFLLNLSQKVKN